ncbi:hypothetical protein RB195_003752 [Necator americanus]|uniref:MSP domain protein n=2 Tax=Necator americanus TaxID=51031 RepID=W2TBL9_NECAM|nr:MSP domain protein [Necator americanus]ETN79435.1 MSP domain protein [Necator americanus]
MALFGSPQTVIFEADGGSAVYTLTNAGMTDLIYKIKSSNNKDYRFKNVYGFIDAGTKLGIEITRTKAPPKNDKFIVQYAPAPSGAKDPQAAWKNQNPLAEISVGLYALR